MRRIKCGVVVVVVVLSGLALVASPAGAVNLAAARPSPRTPR